MAFDPDATRTRFFVNDVGQGTMEEVNHVRLGGNYGWPMREVRVRRATCRRARGRPPA